MQSLCTNHVHAFLFIWWHSGICAPHFVACKIPFFVNTLAPKQSSEKCIYIEQCRHHIILCRLPLPQVCSVLNSNSKHANVEVLKLWSGCRAPLNSAVPSWQLPIFSTELSLQSLPSICCFFIFLLTPPHLSIVPFLPPFLHPNPPPLLLLALVPHSGQCGVSGSGCCWLVGGILKSSGSDEVGGLRICPDSWSLSSPGQTKWQRDSAKEVSPFTRVSRL